MNPKDTQRPSDQLWLEIAENLKSLAAFVENSPPSWRGKRICDIEKELQDSQDKP